MRIPRDVDKHLARQLFAMAASMRNEMYNVWQEDGDMSIEQYVAHLFTMPLDVAFLAPEVAVDIVHRIMADPQSMRNDWEAWLCNALNDAEDAPDGSPTWGVDAEEIWPRAEQWIAAVLTGENDVSTGENDVSTGEDDVSTGEDEQRRDSTSLNRHVADGHVADGHVADGHVANGHVDRDQVVAKRARWEAHAGLLDEDMPYLVCALMRKPTRSENGDEEVVFLTLARHASRSVKGELVEDFLPISMPRDTWESVGRPDVLVVGTWQVPTP